MGSVCGKPAGVIRQFRQVIHQSGHIDRTTSKQLDSQAYKAGTVILCRSSLALRA